MCVVCLISCMYCYPLPSGVPCTAWPWAALALTLGNLPQGTAPLFGGPWGSGLGGSDKVLLCPGGGGGGLFLDRVELPLEVWVLRGSVEGGPVGPRRKLNGGSKVNPSVRHRTTSTQSLPDIKMWYNTQKQMSTSGQGQVHQSNSSQIRGLKKMLA